MSKVAIYCRLSEEDKNKLNKNDDSNSIQNQKSMLLHYALSQKWEVYNIYSDDDYAGADRKRPEFNRLIKDAESGAFDIVLCKTQSRFTREMELVEKYIHGLFPIWGIRFVGLVDNADTAIKGNKKARQINGLVNEWFLEDMSESIKSALTIRRQNGYHIGAFALYGYKKNPNVKGHLIVDEEAATVVRDIFMLFSQGMGKTAIAKYLNDRGIPNPTEYKRQKGLRYSQPKGKYSTLWKYSAISSMLTNEMYIGNMVQGKYGSVSYKTKENKPRHKSEWFVVNNTHEPIIEKELWDKVQKMIKKRAKPFITGNVGIFAGKVVCANCGYTMRSSKSRDEHYLQCATKYVAKDVCDGAFISVKKLESIVVQELNILSRKYLRKDYIEKNIVVNENLNEQKSKLMSDVKQYKEKLDYISRGITSCYMDKVKGLISQCDYDSIVSELNDDKEKYSLFISECENLILNIDEQLLIKPNKSEIIENYLNIQHLTRDIVETMIDRIVVGRRIKGTNNYPIDIYWNF